MHGFSWKRMSEAVSMDVKRSPNSLIICFRHDYVDNIEPVIELGTIFTQKWSVDQKLHRTRSSLFSSVWCLILVSILTMLRSCRLFPEHTQPAKGTCLKHTHTAKGIRCKCDMILLWFLCLTLVENLQRLRSLIWYWGDIVPKQPYWKGLPLSM